MGGIKPHGKGIQITIYWNGERFRPTLKIPPTVTNLKYAERLKAEIERSIALGTYTLEHYAGHFPTSRIARSAPEQKQADSFAQVSTKRKTQAKATAKAVKQVKEANSAEKTTLGDISELAALRSQMEADEQKEN